MHKREAAKVKKQETAEILRLKGAWRAYSCLTFATFRIEYHAHLLQLHSLITINHKNLSPLAGNRFFKAKNYEKALELYMDAMKETPYDIKTLTNIAQVCF